MLPSIYGSSSANNVISAAPPPDVPDSYVSLNGLNASPPGHYLFPKIMGKGETGLAIRQFYYLKYKPMQDYILSNNG